MALWADELQRRSVILPRAAAWYAKRAPTFSDALAAVRREIWHHEGFSMSDDKGETCKIPRVLLERLTHVFAYAA